MEKINWPDIKPTYCGCGELISPVGVPYFFRDSMPICAKCFFAQDSSVAVIEVPKCCSTCHQVNVGQSGEYLCPTCGLPTMHDEAPKE